MTFSRQDWFIAAGLTAAAGVAGWITGAYGWMMCLGALAYIVIQHREHAAFLRWAQRPLRRPTNRLVSWQSAVDAVFRSIKRTRGRNRRALAQLHALRVVADAIPDAAVIIDASGHIEAFNAAARELLHVGRDDVGANLASLIRQPDVVTLIQGGLGDEIVEFPSPYAEHTRLEARRIALEQNQMLVLVRDVTQLNRLLSMRQDFIANVSHELRTPLTVIVGYLETLASEPLDPQTMVALIDKLGSPTRRMQALVDDLLLLTRLEASPTPTSDELQPVQMDRLIESVVADARALSAGAHEIETRLDPGLQLQGIENEIHSACANLVTNAVRYSPDGGAITVLWQEVPTGARFSVSDHGMGIPSEHLSRLTERFYRVDLAKSRVRGGTGLGLAIVKHVLKRHHTHLEIHSQLGQGSRFFCDFPASALVVESTTNQPHDRTQENR